MNTFWGCETENLTTLSTVVGARALRLQALILQIALRVRGTDWFGPDAEDHRVRTEDLVEEVIELVDRLRELGELLGLEAEEQELCSQPDRVLPGVGEPLGGRDTPPWFPEGINVPPLSKPGSRPPWPFGDPPVGLRHPAPLPEGEDFALDPARMPGAERLRRTALGGIPIVGVAQLLPSTHEKISGFYDGIEQGLDDHGFHVLSDAVSLARTPHDISGVVIGEDSRFGQTIASIDRVIANTGQTGQEMFSEISEGDLSGAVRAGERGMYRHAGIAADLLTVSPIPTVADIASDVIGTGADTIAPVAPEAAESLRDVEERVRERGEDWEQHREQVTDPEFYYDLRRSYAPMPWDPQG